MFEFVRQVGIDSRDGFENGITGATWTAYQTGGFVSTTPNQVHRGNYSLHAELDATSSSGSIAQVVETVAVPLPDLYVRVFAYVASGFDSASVAVMTVQQAASPKKGINWTERTPTPTMSIAAM